MTQTSQISPEYLGTTSSTGVYRISLASLGISKIRSITIRDDNFISGGTGAASGFDLDFIKLSYSNSTSPSSIADLAGEPVFDFTNGVRFQRGYEQTWSFGDNDSWNRAYLFGTDPAGNFVPGIPTLGTRDGANGVESGAVSLGEGGTITFTLTQSISTDGLYLYYGDVGGGNDGSYVVFSDSASQAPDEGVTLIGTSGDDEIILGTGFNATLGAGNDTVFGSGGDDVIDGAAGDDRLFGDNGDDILRGSAGNDTLTGGEGLDTLDGGEGNDTADFSDKSQPVVVTLNRAAQLTATVGGVVEDTLISIENVTGGSGNDTLTGDDGANVLRGGLGQDTLDGGAGLDTADFSDRTEAVRVQLNGTSAVTAKVGGVADDQLLNFENVIGGTRSDVLDGDGSANRLIGNDGADTLSGYGGSDILDGGTGGDTLSGGTGRDQLDGGGGDDILSGGDGADTLNGGGGNDTLRGGLGRDLLTGGAGRDVFLFNTKPDIDTVADFTSGSDKIRLSKSVFAGINHTGTLTEGEFYAAAGATSAHDANDRIVYNTATGYLYYDADGKGGAAAVAFAQIGSDVHQALAFNDIQIVA